MEPSPGPPGDPTRAPDPSSAREDYARMAEEHRLAHGSVISIDASHLSVILVDGADVRDFLHRMLSNDVATLASGETRYATLLTVKGKMVADCHILHMDDGWWLIVPSSRREAFVEALSRYVISEDVRFLTDTRSGWVPFGDIVGPLAPELIAKIEGVVEAPSPDRLLSVQGGGSMSGAIVQTLSPSRRARPLGSASRFRVFLRSETAERAGAELIDALQSRGGARGGLMVAETLRMEWATPRFGVDMDESHLPLEADLKEALSFEKGCYVGQEYVVRLAHRGQLNKKLVPLELDCPRDALPTGGAELRSAGGEAVGSLTSAAFSPIAGKGLALGMVKRSHFDPETPLVTGASAPIGVTIRRP